MASRALPDLVARIRVDSTGVDAATAGLVGSFGRANLALAGLAAGIGLLIVGSKSMLDIWREQEKANNDLSQAAKVYGLDLSKNQNWIDTFIKSNSSYVSNQAEVVDNYAKLIRSGLNLREVQRALNDAVDLSALKSISLSDAVDVLNNAEHGRMRGLIDLGITTSKYTDANGDLIKSQHSVAFAMTEVDAKLKGGRDTLDETSQASNRLKLHWQDLAKNGGPVIETLLDTIVGKLDDAYNALDRIGKDDHVWSSINDRLVSWAKGIHDWYVQSGLADIIGSGAVALAMYLLDIKPGTTITIREPDVTLGKGQKYNPNRASGGPVVPGRMYTVGEEGPETLVMGARGGYVIPNSGRGGGSTINVTVMGHVTTERQLTLAIREGIRRMDREQR